MRRIYWFLKTVWWFRKELWNYDETGYWAALRLLTRSLEATRDSIEQRKRHEGWQDTAAEITAFLREMDRHLNSLTYAHRKAGLYEKEYADMLFKPNNELTPKEAATLKIVSRFDEHIETDSWNKAMSLLRRRMQWWWN